MKETHNNSIEEITRSDAIPQVLKDILKTRGESGIVEAFSLLWKEHLELKGRVNRYDLRRLVSEKLREAEDSETKKAIILKGLCGSYNKELGFEKKGAFRPLAFPGAGLFLVDPDGDLIELARIGRIALPSSFTLENTKELTIVQSDNQKEYYGLIPLLDGKAVLICRGDDKTIGQETAFLSYYGRMAERELYGIFEYERGQKLMEDIGIIGILCHELMRPLTPIKGFSQVIYDEFQKILDLLNYNEEKKLIEYYHGKITAKVEDMTKILKTLLHLARIESGKYDVRQEEYDLNNQIIRIGHGVIEDSTEEGKSFRYALSDKTDEIIADSYLFSVSLENVLTNAVRHGKSGAVDVITWLEAGGITVLVINPGWIDDIDEAFQMYKTTKAYSGGTGLGMSIVKRFMEVQGGKVDITNKKRGAQKFVETRLFLPQ